jgi:hypothetical protein
MQNVHFAHTENVENVARSRFRSWRVVNVSRGRLSDFMLFRRFWATRMKRTGNPGNMFAMSENFQMQHPNPDYSRCEEKPRQSIDRVGQE